MKFIVNKYDNQKERQVNKLPPSGRISTLFHKAASYGITGSYRLWSSVFSKQIQAGIENVVLTRQAEIHEAAVSKFTDRLSLAVKIATSHRLPDSTIKQKLKRGLELGVIEQHGQLLFIRPTRLTYVASLLDLRRPEQVKAFSDNCRATGIVFQRHKKRIPGEAYEDENRDFHPYSYVPFETRTDDGKRIGVNRLINTGVSEAKEEQPDIILVPGIFMQHAMFDLAEFGSPARFLADQGYRVYMMDHRGHGLSFNSWDENATFDTHTRYDLPAVIDMVHYISKGRKPTILGYSMGGMEAEFLMAYRGAKFEQNLVELAKSLEPIHPKTHRINESMTYLRSRLEAKTREYLTEKTLEKAEEVKNITQEIKRKLQNIRPNQMKSLRQEEKDAMTLKIHQILDIIDDIDYGIDELSKVKGVIAVGSPKRFDKNSHAVLALLLHLNYLIPTLGLKDVPLHRVAWTIDTFFPDSLVDALFNTNILDIHPLINPDNHRENPDLLRQALVKGTGRIPLGVGLQFLMAIFSGKDFKSLDGQNFRYPEHLGSIPRNIPIAEIFGEDDVFAPPGLHSGYINRFAHRRKSVFPLVVHNPNQLHLPASLDDNVLMYALAQTGHLDFLYGRSSEQLVRPTLKNIIDVMAR